MVLNPDADPWYPVVSYTMLPPSVYYPPPPADFNQAEQSPPPPPPYYQLALYVPFQQPIIDHHVSFPYCNNSVYCQQQHQHPQQPNHEIIMMKNQDLNPPSRDKERVERKRTPCASGERKSFGYVTPPRFTTSRFTASTSARVCNTKVMWKVKKTKPNVEEVVFKQDCGSSIVAQEQNLDPVHHNKTSLMIRNIPNHFRREALLRLLDLYCTNHQLEYDFFYLPMDFMSNNNLGYAFVNFTTSDAASKVMCLLEGQKWNDSQSQMLPHKTSRKVCQVTWARIQGQDELKKNFQHSKFCCNEIDYLPVVFSPPRNGSTCLSNPSTIGILRGNQLQPQRDRRA